LVYETTQILRSSVVTSAFLLGGSGPVGTAVAARLRETGWKVVIASRTSGVRVDRRVPGELEDALEGGFDLLVDIAAFTAEDGEQVNALADRLGSVVVISSASVYADDEGRNLDTATTRERFPVLPLPVAESQATADPSGTTYSPQKVALEQALLGGPLPATVIRPCAIHGPRSRLPRELFFVKRILDGRRRVVLVSNGESRFHTTSLANLAELVLLAAAQPGDRVLNCGDPDPPSTLEICRLIADALDHDLEPVPIPQDGYDRPDLSNPWAVPVPFLVDMTRAAAELGYRPVKTYAEAVVGTARSLAVEAQEKDWSHTYLGEHFDYAAEDALLA
jgi:nucleoside-diphosphate-sugar epimerase